MATTQYRTPGVYVVEKNAFPNSEVEVATAVPLFIGYTEKAQQGTINVANTPVRLSSLREFEATFGGAPRTEVKFVNESDPKSAKLEYANGQRYLLHSSARVHWMSLRDTWHHPFLVYLSVTQQTPLAVYMEHRWDSTTRC